MTDRVRERQATRLPAHRRRDDLPRNNTGLLRDGARDHSVGLPAQPLQEIERFGLLDDQLPAIVWTTDASLQVTWAGGAGLRALDVTPSHVIGYGLFECFQSDELRSPSIAAHQRALRGEWASFDVEFTGSAYQAQVGPMRDADGRIVGVIGIALDVSEGRHGCGDLPGS